MAKPTIVTRASKGSALTWTEGDTNLENLRDATIGITDGTTSGTLDLNDTLTFTAGSNITLGYNATSKALTINSSGGSATPAGSNQEIQFNNSGSFGASSGLTYDGVSLKVNGNLESTYQNGDEGGEIFLKNAATNTTLTNGVTIDVYQNKLRFFENGGSGRGYYVDISSGANSAGTNLAAGGITDVVQDTTPQLGGNLDVQANIITTSTTNGNIELASNGTGDVYLTADTVRVGDADTQATVTTNGAGNLVLNTNAGTNSGNITINQGSNANITVSPNGTGKTVVNNINYKETAFARGAVTSASLGAGTDGNVQTVTLTSTSFTVNGLNAAGASVTMFLTNNGSVSSITQGTGTWKWAGGSKALTATNGTVDVVSIYFDGTTNYASINKGFV